MVKIGKLSVRGRHAVRVARDDPREARRRDLRGPVRRRAPARDPAPPLPDLAAGARDGRAARSDRAAGAAHRARSARARLPRLHAPRRDRGVAQRTAAGADDRSRDRSVVGARRRRADLGAAGAGPTTAAAAAARLRRRIF